jgi:hypothetical protein
MLKMTRHKIELFNDEQEDMLNIFENNKRGGICMISKRYAKCNNKYMKNYKKTLPSSYIEYLDANNLYGWAMSQMLPTGDFRYEDTKTFDNDFIMSLDDCGKRGYYFVVDLDYPNELHDHHNDYPMAPENIKGEYSPLIKNILKKHNAKEDSTSKLITNLRSKRKYGIHYRLLKFYIAHGLVLKKVHTAISFKQKDWLKSYIDFNTRMRAQSNSKFEKDFFKLMNNAVYGKTYENVRKRRDIKLCTSAKQAQRLFNKPKYKDRTIFKDDELIAVEMFKSLIKYDKPIYLGIVILDLSKLLMYQFHYDIIKKKYGDKASLLFTDTDSLCYEIFTEDVYDDFWSMRDMFDFSNYPETHPCHDTTNAKVGKFKDEAKGEIITEFIGLRPKLYSYIIDGDDCQHAKGKGVKKSALKMIKHQNYYKALFGDTKEELFMPTRFNIIRSEKHVLSSVKVEKIGLSCVDNKRYVLDNNINTYAIGHYKTNQA